MCVCVLSNLSSYVGFGWDSAHSQASPVEPCLGNPRASACFNFPFQKG